MKVNGWRWLKLEWSLDIVWCQTIYFGIRLLIVEKLQFFKKLENAFYSISHQWIVTLCSQYHKNVSIYNAVISNPRETFIGLNKVRFFDPSPTFRGKRVALITYPVPIIYLTVGQIEFTFAWICKAQTPQTFDLLRSGGNINFMRKILIHLWTIFLVFAVIVKLVCPAHHVWKRNAESRRRFDSVPCSIIRCRTREITASGLSSRTERECRRRRVNSFSPDARDSEFTFGEKNLLKAKPAEFGQRWLSVWRLAAGWTELFVGNHHRT
jgi:hypothetical protein